MEKYYKLNENSKLYWEYWKTDDSYIIHYGELGTTGETKVVESSSLKKAKSIVRDEEKRIIEQGYKHLDDLLQYRLLIEYKIDNIGSVNDFEKRDRLQERMNATLGWTGLGHCDGGSTGSGTMEVCCFVVDFNLAKNIVINDLANTEFANYSRIFNEDDD